MRIKVCKKCGATKPVDQFEKKYDKAQSPGRRKSKCRTCVNLLKRKKHTNATICWKEWAGGECITCGYKRCMAALDFHHRDPNTKEFLVSQRAARVRLGSEGKRAKALEIEILKCDLLCANCHREIHAAEVV